jgi:hypothetical protein
MTRTQRIVVVVIAGLVIGVLGLFVPDRAATTSSDAAAPGSTVIAEPVKWHRHIAKGKHQTFRKLVSLIREGSLASDSRAAFAFLIADPAALSRVDQALAKLDGAEREDSLKVLFSELMRAPSDPDILYECCKADIETVFENASENPKLCGMYFSWGLSRPMIACLMGHEATSQERFLDLMAATYERTLPLRDNVLGRIDEVRGKPMPNWGTEKYAGDGRYSAEVTTATRASFPMARWIQIVRTDPKLMEKYGEQAERFLALIRETVDAYEPEYRTVPGTNQGYYLNVPKNQAEALNHMAWAGNVLLTLAQLTDEAKYREMAEGIANYYKAAMWTDENGCMVWNYQPQPGNRDFPPKEFSWKARTTIDLPLFFSAHGVVFTEADLQGIARTFTTNIYQSQGNWNAHITSDYRDFAEIGEYNGGVMPLTSFIQLARFDPRIVEMVEERVATTHAAGGWLHRSHGLVAYAYRLKNSR